MSETDARDPALLRSYEGLVYTTASMIVADLRGRGNVTPDDDFDDVMQLLRLKVYRALLGFNLAKARRKRGESAAQTRDRYVFMCVYDMRKDIVKRKRTTVLLIDDIAPSSEMESSHEHGPRDSFDARYLAQTEEDTYAAVEAQLPLIPNTLSGLERAVLVLLYRDYTHREIAARLGTTRGEVSSAVRALRAKLADWRPAGEPLPAVEHVAA